MLRLSLTIAQALVEGMGFDAQYIGAHGNHPEALLRRPRFGRTHQCASDTGASGRSANHKSSDLRSVTCLQRKVRSHRNPAQELQIRARGHEHEIARACEQGLEPQQQFRLRYRIAELVRQVRDLRGIALKRWANLI
jgi:hypothetical protein